MGLTIEQLWKAAKFRPNQAQEQAIRHVAGPLYLPAGPGSGKTRVLLWRTLNLVVFHEVAPEDIYLSTFTEKAALQLTEGLRAMLAGVTARTQVPYDVTQMYVGTVHSLCQRMLTDRRFTGAGRRHQAPVLLDELGQYLFLYRKSRWDKLTEPFHNATTTINQFFRPGSKATSRHQAVANCISLFNRFSEESVDPGAARRLTKDRVLRQLLDLYARYQAELSSGGTRLTDFSLLQEEAYRLLEDHPKTAGLFRHVIVDEYQDTNSIQERIFFKLAAGHKNLCVVGDDDQALYRFRGATVENFVEFPARCRRYLKASPKTIFLTTNYRSRRQIVGFYRDFIGHPYCDWARVDGKGHYRVADKNITAHSPDDGPSVVASTPGEPEEVAAEVARLVKALLAEEKVQDPNQIAFLFPSLKTARVDLLREALRAKGLVVYAPRAGKFLDVEESVAVFGVLLQVFGCPPAGGSHGMEAFGEWLSATNSFGRSLVKADAALACWVKERRAEIARVVTDHRALGKVLSAAKWALANAYVPRTMRSRLVNAAGISGIASRILDSGSFHRVVDSRENEGQPPFSLRYVIGRASSLDWNVLDLFYQLGQFAHFRRMYDLAEAGKDEGPICNLALVSQYLDRFLDEYRNVITGQFLDGDGFSRVLFSGYLYALYRRGESEFEDSEDPFPKGRIPFITVHQAKGLEFPVVVLGNPNKNDWQPQFLEKVIRPLAKREGEPLDRISQFDAMRIFYVALSRAQNLLIIPQFRGKGQRIYGPIKDLLDDSVTSIPALDIKNVPVAEPSRNDRPRTYSYTADYLLYRNCPRYYMIFRKYGFAPSRSQTMFFGSLVHQTLDDLHQLLIERRDRP